MSKNNKIILIYIATFWSISGIWSTMEIVRYGKTFPSMRDSIITFLLTIVLTLVIAGYHGILKPDKPTEEK